MNLYELAKSLRNKADDIETCLTTVRVDTIGPDSIKESLVKLRLIVGDDLHIQIKAPEVDSYTGNRVKCGTWGIYLGSQAKEAHGTHEGVTLEKAVETALDAYKKAMNPDAATVEAEEAVQAVSEAFSEPAPL